MPGSPLAGFIGHRASGAKRALLDFGCDCFCGCFLWLMRLFGRSPVMVIHRFLGTNYRKYFLKDLTTGRGGTVSPSKGVPFHRE